MTRALVEHARAPTRAFGPRASVGLLERVHAAGVAFRLSSRRDEVSAGTGTACPCGNNGTAGRGCANSVNAAGGRLFATGSADLSSDTVVLTTSGLPPVASCLFFQGTSPAGAGLGTVFGDGLRCAAGSVIRLGTKTASGGVASYPTGSDLDVSVKGLVPPAGSVRYYQNWYRNPAVFCTSSTFNLTNGLRITWLP